MVEILSLSDKFRGISFASNNNFIHKMPFCHLIQYSQTYKDIDIAKVEKTLATPTCIRCKFGIQVLKGVKIAIDLD
jgi:hypothetical protein